MQTNLWRRLLLHAGRQGIQVVKASEMYDDLHGFAIVTRSQSPFIAINPAYDDAQQAATLAHEIGHISLNSDSEHDADVFARALIQVFS